MATDGLWDGITPEEAINLANSRISEGKNNYDIAIELTNIAKKYSDDNITVFVIIFN